MHQGYVTFKEGRVLVFFSNSDHFYVYLFDEKTGEKIAIFQGDGEMQMEGDFEGDKIVFSAAPLSEHSSAVFLADVSTEQIIWNRQDDGITYDRVTIADGFVYLNDTYRMPFFFKALCKRVMMSGRSSYFT